MVCNEKGREEAECERDRIQANNSEASAAVMMVHNECTMNAKSKKFRAKRIGT